MLTKESFKTQIKGDYTTENLKFYAEHPTNEIPMRFKKG